MNDTIKLCEETIYVEFSLKRMIIEDHYPLHTAESKKVYCVKFCDNLSSYSNYFCSVGAHYFTIYSIDKLCNINIVQSYADCDVDEVFYCCTWAYNESSHSLLVAIAGLRGTIKVINISNNEIETVLLGHGNSVNDLRTHPLDDNLILSASKDESIRLWNIKLSTCIAIFAGDKGHRDEVVCIDIHLAGNCFVSAGINLAIMIWSLEDPIIATAIDESSTYSRKENKKPFNTLFIQYPLFSTTQVHSDYVDSVKWVGNCILSKSTKNRVVLWSPDADRYKGAPLILREYSITNCNLWFIRMDVCIPLDIFAVGNSNGKVMVYRISTDSNDSTFINKSDDELIESSSHSSSSSSTSNIKNVKKKAQPEIKENFETDLPQSPSVILSNNTSKDSKPTVRQVSFDVEGRYIIYCCDDGSISLWSIQTS